MLAVELLKPTSPVGNAIDVEVFCSHEDGPGGTLLPAVGEPC